MPGPLPKDPAVRQRANRKSTRAMLAPAKRCRKMPDLPIEEPHELTVAFWRDVWASPMASEYLDADVHGLYLLARLVDNFWAYPSTALAAEIRHRRMAYGLTPIDRRRLEWSIKNYEEPVSGPTPRRVTDARQVLRAIS